MKKLFTKLIIAILVVIIGYGTILAVQGYQMCLEALDEKPLSQMVGEIRSQDDYSLLEDLPPLYLHAVIATEDQRFYNHSGIDVIAIGRAIWFNMRARSFVEGGSTITQQLAKNQYFTQEKVLVRKVADAFMAIEIEKQYDKNEILELYVNTIYFGDGYHGIYAASQGYFQKDPNALTDFECSS